MKKQPLQKVRQTQNRSETLHNYFPRQLKHTIFSEYVKNILKLSVIRYYVVIKTGHQPHLNQHQKLNQPEGNTRTIKSPEQNHQHRILHHYNPPSRIPDTRNQQPHQETPEKNPTTTTSQPPILTRSNHTKITQYQSLVNRVTYPPTSREDSKGGNERVTEPDQVSERSNLKTHPCELHHKV